MERTRVEKRPNWVKKVEDIGFTYHTIPNEGFDPTYWDESVAYRFTAPQIDTIEEATQEIYTLCLSAVQHVIDKDLFYRLSITKPWADLIRKSWERQDIDVYGRFDLTLDAAGVPKLLEFNADTPTSLYEAAVVQWMWLEDQNGTGKNWDQFNSIHEKLIAQWGDVKERYTVRGTKVHFASMLGDPAKRLENWCDPRFMEDRVTVDYMQDCAKQAGLDVAFIGIEDIGWNGIAYTDLDERAITTLFKLYPWEHMVKDQFGKHILTEPWDMIEPAWKMILSNKGILPILWELYPDHKYLLPTFTAEGKLGNTYVKKPLLSREGANVTIVKNGEAKLVNDQGYGEEGFVYQQYSPIKNFDGNYPVIGSWVVGGRACGMGIREDANEVTGNSSRFVPHYFTAE